MVGVSGARRIPEHAFQASVRSPKVFRFVPGGGGAQAAGGRGQRRGAHPKFGPPGLPFQDSGSPFRLKGPQLAVAGVGALLNKESPWV